MATMLRTAGRIAGYSMGAGAFGTAAVGAYLYQTEPGAERAVRFWRRTAPIVFNYWWARQSSSDEETKMQRYSELHELHAIDARELIEDLRGMFVKIGQVLSVRPEVVPEAYQREFRRLQDQAPPSQWEPIRETLERDLGAPLSELFDKIDQEPLGAASIGQAHLAEWKGQKVVVKVQYPDAPSIMKADFWCLESLLWLIGEDEVLRLAKTVHDQFKVELDYAQEAVHLDSLQKAIADAPGIYGFNDRVAVPRLIPELTKGSVIGMEYLPGEKLEVVCRRRLEALGIDFKGQSFMDWLATKARDSGGQLVDLKSTSKEGVLPDNTGTSTVRWRIASALLRLVGVDFALRVISALAEWRLRLASKFSSLSSGPVGDLAKDATTAELREILRVVLDVHGFQLFFGPFFNGDPHPGNILMLPDGRVGLIDFGQCKSIGNEERKQLANLFVKLSDGRRWDGTGVQMDIADAFRETGTRSRNDTDRIMSLMPRLMFCDFNKEVLNSELLKDVFTKDRVEHMPMHVILVYRAAMLLRGLCLVLQENISVADAWKPWAERFLLQESE